VRFPRATRHLSAGGEGFDFLGFHHRLVRARGRTGARRITFLARWPSRQAAQHARDRIRELTDRSRLLVPVDQVVREVNSFLRGWAGYFRYGNSAREFDKISTFALARSRCSWPSATNAAGPGDGGWWPTRTPVVSG
jgi:Group II intron, maturase-specific domain